MPLDFHIAKTKQHAPYEPALGSFDELTHGIIFERSLTQLGTNLENRFPLFYRMRDYYGDAQFSHEELVDLQAEISQLTHTLPENSAVLEQLDIIGALCQKAISDGMSIWVFCD